jgi:hypothetical protein
MKKEEEAFSSLNERNIPLLDDEKLALSSSF